MIITERGEEADGEDGRGGDAVAGVLRKGQPHAIGNNSVDDSRRDSFSEGRVGRVDGKEKADCCFLVEDKERGEEADVLGEVEGDERVGE